MRRIRLVHLTDDRFGGGRLRRRRRYVGYVRNIADKWLDWKKLGPIATQYHALIAEDVKVDTRKLFSTEAFLSSVEGETSAASGFGGPGGPAISLKSFAEKRRAYLLERAMH